MNNIINLIIILLLVAIAIEVYLVSGEQRNPAGRVKSKRILIDTSALIDGRVVGLAEAGFLFGEIIVPRSVLGELQLLADGADHQKREKARLGMDAVNELKRIMRTNFSLYEDSERADEGVDSRLLTLAKQIDASVMTLDYNLNKVAKVVDVEILNINELAKSLRMSHIPGEIIELTLTTAGQEAGQAVGHLSDGTMMVVESAKKYIGQTKKVEIIRSLQTDAGKMMFARLASETAVRQESNNSQHKPRLSSNRRQPIEHRLVDNHRSVKKTHSNRSVPSSTRQESSKPKSSPINSRRLSQSQHEDELVRLANQK